ncbi:hypothetical protein C8Q78DRAFT_1083148 [Trametes maxima]|nr:hypothetical protein C8Q78DRAFT_1083148 [Trametes maxima]
MIVDQTPPTISGHSVDWYVDTIQVGYRLLFTVVDSAGNAAVSSHAAEVHKGNDTNCTERYPLQTVSVLPTPTPATGEPLVTIALPSPSTAPPETPHSTTELNVGELTGITSVCVLIIVVCFLLSILCFRPRWTSSCCGLSLRKASARIHRTRDVLQDKLTPLPQTMYIVRNTSGPASLGPLSAWADFGNRWTLHEYPERALVIPGQRQDSLIAQPPMSDIPEEPEPAHTQSNNEAPTDTLKSSLGNRVPTALVDIPLPGNSHAQRSRRPRWLGGVSRARRYATDGGVSLEGGPLHTIPETMEQIDQRSVALTTATGATGVTGSTLPPPYNVY